jgi:hypothetical protein
MTEAIAYRGQTRDKGFAAAAAQLRGLLVPGETVVAEAIEHRLYALLHRRHLAAATTGRVLTLSRPLLGGYEPTAIRWQDLKDVAITVGMFTATVTIRYSADMSDTAGDEGHFQTLRIASLHKAAAEALYRECQAQEQSWREKRRVRSMEEMRARSGATQIATGIYPPQSPAPAFDRPIEHAAAAHESPAQRLARAKEMLDDGLLNDSEYEAIKARIIGAL